MATSNSRASCRSSATVLVICACTLISACGSGESDGRDEVGAPAEEDTRVELIFIDSESDSLARPAEGARAEEEAPPPAAPTAADEVGGDDILKFDAAGRYTIQIATYKKAKDASRRVRELETLGYPAYAVAHPTGEQTRVRVGYFTTREEADRFGQRFCRDHGGKYWVDGRSSEITPR